MNRQYTKQQSSRFTPHVSLITHHSSRFTFHALLLLLLGWLLLPGVALAHAKLLESSPAANAILDASPTGIRLSFSEAVTLEFSQVKLLDRTRKEYPVGPLRESDGGTVVSADLPQILPTGTYTVLWRVISAVDGHLTVGNYAFRVRAIDEPTPVPGSTPETITTTFPIDSQATPLEGATESPDPFRWLARAITFAMAALLLGGALFTVAVIEPSAAERGAVGAAVSDRAKGKFARIGAFAAGVLFLALVYDLLAQVATVSGADFGGVFGKSAQAMTLLTDTRYGFSWLLKALAALLLMVIMLFVWLRLTPRLKLGPTAWDAATAIGSLFLLAQSLGSHAAAISSGSGQATLGLPIPIISDWLHLATASAWVGGLGYMALALFPAFRALRVEGEERRAFLGRAVPRFSRLALFSVVVLGITGTYSLLTHSNDLGSILGSSYGQVLAVKVALFVLLVGLGAANLFRLSPGLKDEGRRTKDEGEQTAADGGAAIRNTQHATRNWSALLQRNVRVEVVLATLALGCAGGLTLLPPPSAGGSNSNVSPPTVSASQATATARAAANAPLPTLSLPTIAPTPQPATVATDVEGYNLELNTRPALEGDELTLTLVRKGRDVGVAPPLTDVLKVIFKVTPQDIDAGSTLYTAALQGEAGADRQAWKITEPVFTIDAIYLVTVVVQRTQTDDIKAAFELTLAENVLKAIPSQVVEVRVTTNPSPPISGTATLILTLVDGTGGPIEGAKVSVSPLMPAHAHVEPTDVAQPLPGSPGKYTLPVNFVMGGPWLIILNVEREGQPPIKTDATVEVEGPEITPTPR